MPEAIDSRVITATTAEHIAAAAALFREYAASLPFPLDYQGFEAELAALPGKYAPPGGCIVLALDGGEYVGCGAIRPLDPSGRFDGEPSPACEMKRMYIRPSARGKRLGRAIAEALLAHARAAGYRLMKLDTEEDFIEAMRLYESLGFTRTRRYNNDPMPCTVWMSKEL
ncbi:MAG TPA: GNAT family N-acetyltransferase [Phycisphaerales bacterium]|nr:GNAT family N-acetyltransferase [Phycisphaerales bacterium]